MQPLIDEATQLKENILDAIERLDIQGQERELSRLDEAAANPDLWQDQATAQKVMKKQAAVKARTDTWRGMQKSVQDVLELAESGDESLLKELKKQLQTTKKKYRQLKTELLFNGKYDNSTAIVSIYAGAGGTDAQDWAQMLQRMYLRYGEKQDATVTIVDESSGDEAGIKSATLEVDMPFAYGKLKGEHGVHRLVRLSPFNSDNLRQTSFAKIDILPKIDEPEDVKLDETDLKIDVYRAGGKGGQSVNTTDSAVRITHVPTGIAVAIQNERSQLQNKETAMSILRSKLAQLQQEQHEENLSKLKGPNEEAAWGNQIRSYVLHPYKQVKDLRTEHVSKDPDAVLDGKLDDFISAYLNKGIGTVKK